jgi:hypothetical protein
MILIAETANTDIIVAKRPEKRLETENARM